MDDTGLTVGYMDYVNRAVDYIESNLKREVTLDEICSQTAYSKVHFQRIFLYTVGETVSQYIKNRRLTEAAKELARTDRSVLEIATDWGYESQEAFTRAFKKIFYATPAKYRRLGLHFTLKEKKRLKPETVEHLKGGINLKPRMVKKDAFKVVGLKYYGDDPKNNCPKLWKSFFERIGEIENQTGKMESFGLMCTGEEVLKNDLFDYIACVEVTDFGKIPEGMTAAEVPEAMYAVFTHKGSLDNLQQTYEYIYGTWFPKSGYEPVGMNEFEYYDTRFTGEEGSELDIYVPVKPGE